MKAREKCNYPSPIGNQGWASPARKACVRKIGHPGPHWNALWEWFSGEYPVIAIPVEIGLHVYAEFRYLAHWLRHPTHVWCFDGLAGWKMRYKACECGHVLLDLRKDTEEKCREF